MGTKVTKQLFERVTSEEVAKLFRPLGFTETDRGAFNRRLGKVVQGFGFTRNPSFTHFNVEVGASVSDLYKRLDYVAFGRAHYATLLVSRPLGLLTRDARGERTFYHFATVEELKETFPKVYADFVEQAEPWLAELVTVDDVAKEFHKWRIAPPSIGEKRPPDPFAWAIYGWLLEEAGRVAESKPWLERALEEVRNPRYGKAGRLVPRGTKGARLIEWNQAEVRLRELLEEELEPKDRLIH